MPTSANGLPVPFLQVNVGPESSVSRDLTPLVKTVTVEDHDRLMDEARMTFKDPDNRGAELIGKDDVVTVELGWNDEHAIVFEGVVVDVLPQAGADETRTLTVVAHDLSHDMGQEVKSESHDASTLQSLVEKIAERNGWAGKRAEILCKPNPWLSDQGLSQHNQTDYQYLQALAARFGGRMFVEYNKGASTLYWVSTSKLQSAKASCRLKYCRGSDRLIEFKYKRIAARSARQVTAHAVDPESGEVKTTVTPAPPATAAPGEQPPAPPPPAVAVGLPSDPVVAERATIHDPTRVLGYSGTGRAVGTIKLRAKSKVELAGLPAWAEGDWYVCEATHSWTDTSTPEVRRATYETSFTATR